MGTLKTDVSISDVFANLLDRNALRVCRILAAGYSWFLSAVYERAGLSANSLKITVRSDPAMKAPTRRLAAASG